MTRERTSYRTDWPLDHDRVGVAYFDADLSAARRKARQMSRKVGLAYVIIRDEATKSDIGQILYIDGEACSRGFLDD